MMLFICSFVWPFLGIQLCCWIGMTFLGFSTKLVRPVKLTWTSLWLQQYLKSLNRFNSWLKWLSRNWLRTNSWLKWIHRYWFRSTHDLKCFPISLFKSTQGSNEKHSILSRLMIRLWVGIHVCSLLIVAKERRSVTNIRGNWEKWDSWEKRLGNFPYKIAFKLNFFMH